MDYFRAEAPPQVIDTASGAGVQARCALPACRLPPLGYTQGDDEPVVHRAIRIALDGEVLATQNLSASPRS